MNIKASVYLIIVVMFLNVVLLPVPCPAQKRDNVDFPSYLESEPYLSDYYDDDDEDYYTDYSGEEYPVDSYEEMSDYTSEEPPVVESRPPRLAPGAPIKLEEKSIRLGRIPYRSLREMMTQAVPLLRLLQKRTGAKEVRFVSSGKDYASILDSLARGNIDFAWIGPTAYLGRRDKDALMPIAKTKFGAETAYRGVFIAPAKGRVQGLEDIKGSKIGFVDPESASGYIYPLYLLLRLGINPHTDSTVYFMKNHDNVLRAILAGKLDAGVCLEDTLNSLKDKSLQDKIIILAKTNEIPSDVIVCRQDCPLNLRERFFEALLSVKANELPGSPTFIQAFDEDFVEVEAVMKYIDSLKKKN